MSEEIETFNRNISEWVREGKHLPKWLRDFHDQKDVFKTCEQVLGRHPENFSWVDGQIYTIDCFLKFMAFHGYTLRRTRKEAFSIYGTIKGCKEKRDSAVLKVLTGAGQEAYNNPQEPQ